MKLITAFSKGACILSFLLILSFTSFSQNNFKVSGRVTDDEGKPLTGATVTVKGTKIATATTTDGFFTINAPSGNSVLVITSVGFAEQEIAVNNKSEVNISMATLASSL